MVLHELEVVNLGDPPTGINYHLLLAWVKKNNLYVE